MKIDNLTGKWIGQYSQQLGTGDSERTSLESFEMDLIDENGEISGKAIDLDLNNEPATISGFYEDGILSFIKKYNRHLYQDEDGNILADNDSGPMEINYTAQYDDEEKGFLGTWEILVEETQIGNQEEYEERWETGSFLIRRIK